MNQGQYDGIMTAMDKLKDVLEEIRTDLRRSTQTDNAETLDEIRRAVNRIDGRLKTLEDKAK